MNDLPGQMTLFPEPVSGGAADAADAVRALRGGLPAKDTVTVVEAASQMGCSRRTVERWIDDGTLLVCYANRDDETARRHARIIVRDARPYNPARKKFLTLEELRVRRSNVGG